MLITLNTESSSGRQFLRGVADYARHFGAWRFLCEPAGLAHVRSSVEGDPFDGVITMDLPRHQDLLALGLPTVAILHEQAARPDTIAVDTDDAGVAAAAEHFLQRGYQQFAFFGRQTGLWSLQREATFVEQIEAAGCAVEVLRARLISASKGDSRFDTVDVLPWLEALAKPVAIFAANDHFARYLLEQCRIAGIRVPQECAVLGVGADSYVCELVNPSLSSDALGFQQAGYLAAQALEQQMRGGLADSLRITARAGHVVLRRSRDALAVNDPLLARALQYLQERSHCAVEVKDVAAHIGVSRRNLEHRFRKGMDTSVLKYHRSLRAEHIAQVLLESNLSLEAISEQCGFSEPGNLTRFFKSVTGESPSAYCKRMRA